MPPTMAPERKLARRAEVTNVPGPMKDERGAVVKICLVGEGAISRKHMAALERIDDVEVTTLAGGDASNTEAFAKEFDIPHWSLELAECLARPQVEAALIASSTPMHARQAEQALLADKHVLLEIPMSESLADAERLCEVQQKTGLTAMVCHTRRFNPSHQWIHERIQRGELTLQHLVVETFFFRRTNKNALGQPRSWTDHLLWHHACHTVDLFQYQTGAIPDRAWAQQGPPHAELGIAMDMTIGLGVSNGPICSLALSFNNDGPLGTFFRYICDNGTYIARYDELVNAKQEPIDLSAYEITDGFEIQAREFFGAIGEGREPNASFRQCLPAMQTLDRLERTL